MLPSFSMNNVSYVFWNDIEHSSQFPCSEFIRNIKLTYFQNLRFCKFREMTFRSRVHAFLRNCVFHVFVMRSKKQMVWSYAGLVVASMKNPQTIFYFPVVKFPGISMRWNLDFLSIFKHCESPISTTRTSSCPCPTSRSFYYLHPKSYFGRFYSISHFAWVAFSGVFVDFFSAIWACFHGSILSTSEAY